MEKTMAEVAYSVNGARVFVRYKDLVDEPKAMTAEELVAAANAVIAAESGSGEISELPEMAELRSLKTRVAKEVVVADSEESGSESGKAAAKYVLVASLRYMTKVNESESL